MQPSAPAEMTMSLAKSDGRKNELENKKRAGLSTRVTAGALAVETEKVLPELADASKIESMPREKEPLSLSLKTQSSWPYKVLQNQL